MVSRSDRRRHPRIDHADRIIITDEELEYYCQLDLDSRVAGAANMTAGRFSDLVRQLDVSIRLVSVTSKVPTL
jgi:hypothetical protein